jgi:hypothetical protein
MESSADEGDIVCLSRASRLLGEVTWRIIGARGNKIKECCFSTVALNLGFGNNNLELKCILAV